MPDLVTFLGARIDEDEAAARQAGVGGWTSGSHEITECVVDGPDIRLYDEGGHDEHQARHIVRWEPRRVIAECEAKRALVDEHRREHDPCDHAYDTSLMGWLCITLRTLALPYADHPDYRDEWRP